MILPLKLIYRIPFVIAADLSQDIHTLSAWKAFEHLGCKEGFEYARSRLGKELPPTCRNATRFDSFIFHPALLDTVCDMWVGPEHLFADHSPIYARFKVTGNAKIKKKLFVPTDWSGLAFDKKLFASHYLRQAQELFLQSHIDSSSTPEQKMHMWSRTLERALDATIRQMNSEDPVQYPLKNLPRKFQGRCAPPRWIVETPTRSVKNDVTGLFNPASEPTALRNCNKARQTRRLMSLLRQLNRKITLHQDWQSIPQACRLNMQKEWDCIRKAQGYGVSWERWVLGFEAVPFLPLEVPSISLLHNLVQLTKHDAEISFRQEEKNRRLANRHMIQIDQKENNGSLVFKAMRDPEHKIITGMPCACATSTRLLRLSKGKIRLLLSTDLQFRPGPATYGDTPV